MTIQQLIDDFYANDAKDNAILDFAFEELDHNEPCPFTRLNSRLLDVAEKNDISKMVLRYPASNGFALSLVLYRTIHALASGDSVLQEFDPATFEPNQKIKIGTANVVFWGFYEMRTEADSGMVLNPSRDINKINYICVKFYTRKRNDTSKYYYPIRNIPFIERISQSAKLSTREDFISQWSQEQQANIGKDLKDPIQLLKFKKAAKCETTFLVTDTKKFVELIDRFTINKQPLLDTISISITNRSGKLESLNGAGSYPQIILSDNFEEVYLAMQQYPDLVCKYAYADLNYVNELDEDMDFIDMLLENDMKLYFFAPENKDYDLANLKSREFTFFAWNPDMITGDMVRVNREHGSYVLQNFQQNTIQPYLIADERFSKWFSELHQMSNDFDQMSDLLKSFYCSVMKLLFFQLRNCSQANSDVSESLVEVCEGYLEKIKEPSFWNFISQKELVQKSIDVYEQIHAEVGQRTPKQLAIENTIIGLNQLSQKDVCLIVPGDNDRYSIEKKLSYKVSKQKVQFKSLSVKAFEDFLNGSDFYDYVIIAGWLNKQKMKQILLSNKSRKYIPILYSCEYKWFGMSVGAWDSQSNAERQSDFMEAKNESERKPRWLKIDKRWVKETPTVSIPSEQDILQDFQKKRFSREFSKTDNDKLVSVIPIGFNDGSSGYYTLGYNLITLADASGNLTCSSKESKNVKLDDFVLFREFSKDLLNDLTAKRIGDSAEKVFKVVYEWKTAIQSQLEDGKTEEEVMNTLRKGGITISDQELGIWMDPSNGLICPGRKESLEIIGKVLNDSFITNNIEKIWDYASRIRGLHVQIGRSISASISRNKQVLDRLSALHDDDALSAGVQVDIPDVGLVTILKVTDIGDVREIPRRESNRRL